MRKLTNVKVLLVLMLVLSLAVVGCGKSASDDNYDGDATTLGDALKAENEAGNDNEVADTDGTEETNDTENQPTDETAMPEPVEVIEVAEATLYPISFLDKFGNEMTIEAMPEKIVSFSPEMTETLFAIGAGEQVIGRSTWCDYPAEALDVADMGDLWNFNLEALIESGADVVVLSSMVSEDIYQQILDNGMTPVVFDFDTNLVGTLNYIRLMGQITDKQEGAVAIINDIRKTIFEVEERAETREAKSVYYVVAAGEYTSAATGDTFINDIIETIGATNAAADGTNWQYTVEQLVEKDPDFVVCSQNWDTKATIESLDGYKDLTAVKEGRLVEVDENIFSRQGPRIIDAILALEAAVYGE